jgi:uncharacterized protein YyaL (SSP411 family)
MTSTKSSTNRLIHETSPYLQQHAHNPVDWYPWGKEALDRAKRETKPIFLSIGYSACHWCHVMEHESFEDEETAKIMNSHFINIKVDREERQDLDHIYMAAVQVLTQHGGWPMSVFLTPELKPFYGGTYFPPEDRMGMPSFKKVLLGVANAWGSRREDVLRSADQLRDALDEMNRPQARGQGAATLTQRSANDLVDNAARTLAGIFDPAHGGFGPAPKFFHAMDMKVLLRHWKRTGDAASLSMVSLTLDRLARGGIYDQLGGGFHRYSTDVRWLVPHFEKMLYDNALLADLYLETYQITRRTDFAETARETLDYVLREMTSSEGGFFSTQDADSEGEEGKFYVWSKSEIDKVLDPELATQFRYFYDISGPGNWEGKNILNRPRSWDEAEKMLGQERAWLEESLAAARRKLFAVRTNRVVPFRDEKILTSWNGLMIETMAHGYQVLGDQRYLAAAKKAAAFILGEMRGPAASGVRPLLHSYKDGQARFTAYLDDYASLLGALIALYECEFDPAWLERAKELGDLMLDRFWDKEHDSFYYTASDHEPLITRPKDFQDGATPSGSSLAVTALAKLGHLLSNNLYLQRVERALLANEPYLKMIPTATGQWLTALAFVFDHPQEIALIEGGSRDDFESALHLVRESFLPNKVMAAPWPDPRSNEKLIPWLHGKKAVQGKTTLYLCENFTCQDPLVGLEAIKKALGGK